MSEFIDVILGKCKFKDRFYVTNHFYGGYAYDCEEGFGNVSYADPNTVIDLAEASKMTVHLAGASAIAFPHSHGRVPSRAWRQDFQETGNLVSQV